MIARRRVLRAALAAGGLAALAPTLSSCGSSGTGHPPTVSTFGVMSLRLPWIKDVRFAGSYLADIHGYYTAEGFDQVEVLTGGPTATAPDAAVAGGKALFGISSPDRTAAAIAQGAPVVIIGAQYQTNPWCVLSMAATPINTPNDLYGKKIGVQPSNASVWAAYLKAAGLDPSRITTVPVQVDPIGLTQGDVDGWFSFVTDEPNQLIYQGFKVATMLLADHGYPMVSATYVTRTELVRREPDLVKAFLRAEIKGWKDNLADPGAGATLAATQYGQGLGLTTAEQLLQSTAENELIRTADTRAHGLFTVTDALRGQTVDTLGRAGFAADRLFDLTLLDEVYVEDPSLLLS